MTYVRVALPISPLFFGSLFPICSQFVPSFSDCTPAVRQFSMGTTASRALPQCLGSRFALKRTLAAGRARGESQAGVGNCGVLRVGVRKPRTVIVPRMLLRRKRRILDAWGRQFARISE